MFGQKKENKTSGFGGDTDSGKPAAAPVRKSKSSSGILNEIDASLEQSEKKAQAKKKILDRCGCW